MGWDEETPNIVTRVSFSYLHWVEGFMCPFGGEFPIKAKVSFTGWGTRKRLPRYIRWVHATSIAISVHHKPGIRLLDGCDVLLLVMRSQTIISFPVYVAR